MPRYDKAHELRQQAQRRFDRQESALRKHNTTRLQELVKEHLAHKNGKIYTPVHLRP